jgi:hypothetical protein
MNAFIQKQNEKLSGKELSCKLAIIILLFPFYALCQTGTGNGDSGLAPLPVTLTYLKAYEKSSGINIEWGFSEELNADKYEIERSKTGSDFTKVGTVVSTGNHTMGSSYSWFDDAPLIGISFYRLRMIDKKGAFICSNVIKVVTASSKDQSIAVYPNPIQGNTFTLQMNNIDKGTHIITLTNMSGQVVYSNRIIHSGGTASQTIDLNNKLSHGMFTLRMDGFAIQVIKQ